MAASDPRALLFVPGRIIKAPTDFTIADAGGTVLGEAGGVVFRRNTVNTIIHGGEFGCTVDMLYNGESGLLLANLRTWDQDAIDTVFNRTSTGGTSGLKGVEHHHSSYRPGQLGSARATGIAFVPDNPLSHRGVFFPLAIPLVADQLNLTLGLEGEGVYPVVFRAIPPSSGATVQHMLIEDMVVP